MRKSSQTALPCLCFTDCGHFATLNGGIPHIRFFSTIHLTFSYVRYYIAIHIHLTFSYVRYYIGFVNYLPYMEILTVAVINSASFQVVWIQEWGVCSRKKERLGGEWLLLVLWAYYISATLPPYKQIELIQSLVGSRLLLSSMFVTLAQITL